MDIGIPAERNLDEFRVGLTPQGVRLLTQAGHRCFIERGAGEGAGFDNVDYERAGGRIVYEAHEAFERADVVVKVVCPTLEELDMLRENQTVCAFMHLMARPRKVLQTFVDKRITAVAYESIRHDDGTLPVLRPLSEIAGRMAPQVAAHWLQNDAGGRGILLGGIAGIPPANVVIIGAGTVGLSAARAFFAVGARVMVLDTNHEQLQIVDRLFEGRIATMVAYDFNIASAVRRAHVVVGAVLVPGQPAPKIVTREMVRSMRPRSLIMDVSIDEGGCVETSRPMTHADPIFESEGMLHYCVPNISSVVARTATHAYLNAAWPYMQALVEHGIDEAIASNATLRRGVAVQGGEILNENLKMLVVEA